MTSATPGDEVVTISLQCHQNWRHDSASTTNSMSAVSSQQELALELESRSLPCVHCEEVPRLTGYRDCYHPPWCGARPSSRKMWPKGGEFNCAQRIRNPNSAELPQFTGGPG